ncbi:hypothetical protein R3P38DRAFT_3567235 [Favolaschia claudopus]|uniref:Uncharacterized protein n=1 Tax=Favolaschia claudopus TaxID=2862362 RepID=A0AAW0AUX5_9AGAR
MTWAEVLFRWGSLIPRFVIDLAPGPFSPYSPGQELLLPPPLAMVGWRAAGSASVLFHVRILRCEEYQYLVNIPGVDPSMISPCRSEAEHAGISDCVVSFAQLGTVNIEHYPDYLATGDGFNVVVEAFGGQDRPHHVLEVSIVRILHSCLIFPVVKAASDILRFLFFEETNPADNPWGDNHEMIELISRFYLLEPGHPHHPDQVIGALIDADSTAARALEAAQQHQPPSCWISSRLPRIFLRHPRIRRPTPLRAQDEREFTRASQSLLCHLTRLLPSSTCRQIDTLAISRPFPVPQPTPVPAPFVIRDMNAFPALPGSDASTTTSDTTRPI